MEPFLTNRTQNVAVDGHLSLIAWVISGVLQQAVPGHILFLINDITDCVKYSTLRFCADDSKMYAFIFDTSWVADLQKDLEEVT